MGLIVSRRSSMLSIAAVLILATTSGCKMSSWSMPGMGWLNGGSNETAPQPSVNQPGSTTQAVPSNNAQKYLNPPTISTGTPSNFGDTAASTETYSSGRTTAYSGRNTIGPYRAPKRKAVATTQPAASSSPTQYPTTQYPANGYRTAQNPTAQYPTTQAPATQYPATQYPTTQTPATQYPATQYPATQAPATQYPATQYPATQYPATQYPATQAPATQYPATQYPATNPSAGAAYPAKTADTRSATSSNDSANGNYQGGFYAPQRDSTTTFPAQPKSAQPLAPVYSNPQPSSYGQGAANTKTPNAPAAISTKPDFALPVAAATATETAQQTPYGIDADPYAGQTGSTGAASSQFPVQSPPTAYRPGSTGRLDPTSVPQQDAYPVRSSQFNASGN